MIVILIYFGVEFETDCATLRPASTCLAHTSLWLDSDANYMNYPPTTTRSLRRYLGQGTGKPQMCDQDM